MNRYRCFLCCFLLVLGACAHRQPVIERVTPPEVFKVHPGLLGEPVPPELQPAPDALTIKTQTQNADADAARR
jgi:hypothetical protein